ncbi:hypothetical protein O181_065240 [Austropuccinia psidii MF-1]|uniref:DUF4939 domain-containing protein n=1 Tax=Austropuccinia psidii MF-1 TaxID=1389203 RepID=A0A9Q3ELW7_9BASI|nr:hypothetical protein [Austropuccinia psidii MF-1]
MPFQHSPPARQTRSQAKDGTVLTPASRVPLDGAPEVPQLRAHLYRGPNMEGKASSRKEGRGPRRKTLSQLNQPGSHQFEPYLLAIIQKMTQIMANLQANSSSKASRPTGFNTSSMKVPDCFDDTQSFKVRGFIQSFQLIINNYQENFFEDKKKDLYATSFLIGRASKWIEPYVYNLTNQDPTYLLSNWELFESQPFTLFGDPNEVRRAAAELNGLRTEERGHIYLYIADFRSFCVNN